MTVSKRRKSKKVKASILGYAIVISAVNFYKEPDLSFQLVPASKDAMKNPLPTVSFDRKKKKAILEIDLKEVWK